MLPCDGTTQPIAFLTSQVGLKFSIMLNFGQDIGWVALTKIG